MAKFKPLNIITAVYFLCSAGISTWIGFELYYTINPKNKVITYVKDGKVDTKPVPSIESTPKGKKLEEPEPFKSVPLNIKKGSTEKQDYEADVPVTKKVENLKPDPPIKEPKTVDLEPLKVVKDERHKHPTEEIKKVQPSEDDDLLGTDTNIDLHTPVRKVEKKKVLQEPVSDPETFPPKPQLDDAKTHTPEEPTVGVFTDLYYGLSNKKEEKAAVLEEKALKDAPPKLDPQDAKLKVEEPTVGIFTDLYYGLSNKKEEADLPEKRVIKEVKQVKEDATVGIFTDLYYGLSNKKEVESPPKPVIKEVKQLKVEEPTVGIFTDLYYYALTKTPPKTKVEKTFEETPPGRALETVKHIKTEEPTVGVFTDLYYGLSNKIPKPEKAKPTLEPKVPAVIKPPDLDIKHPSVDLERPALGHTKDTREDDEASQHLRDKKEKIQGGDGYGGLEDSADEFFT